MISLLTKLPLIGKVLTFFKTKPRLICEYGLIAAVVIIGGFTVTQWYSKTQIELRLAQAETQLATVGSRLVIVETVNEAHQRTIESLRDLRERDVVALEGLLNDYLVLSMRDGQIRRQLDALHQSNLTVQKYLDQPVPDELVRLLNGTSTAGNPDSYKD